MIGRVALLCALLVTTVARAQVPDLLALGRQEYEAGQREYNLGHYDKALDHFEASYRLTARPQLLFNLGQVDRRLFEQTRKLELLEQAVERYRAFLSSTKAEDAQPAVHAQRERAARELESSEADLVRERAQRAQGEETLAVGEQFLQQGRLKEARAELQKFVKTPLNERPSVARAHLLDGHLALAEGDARAATDAFARALSLDKSVQLREGASPAAVQAFAEAQQRVGALPPVAVQHAPPASSRPGAPVELTFALVSDPMHLVAGLQVFYRASGGAFSSLPRAAPGRLALPRVFTATLLPGARIEYYANVVDENGAVLQHLGSPALPFAIQVERPHESVARRGWFWGVMAGVAAVAATGIGLGVYYSQPAPPTHVPVNLGLHLP